MKFGRQWVTNLSLWPRMALAMSLGFLALFVAFSTLSERALHESTDRILEERLVISQMSAGQLDSLLQRAVGELEQAPRFGDFDPADPDLSDEAHTLAHTYVRGGTFTSGIAFLDTTGRVVLSHPPALYQQGANLAGLPHVAQALHHRDVTVSTPFRSPVSNEPVAAVTVPIYDGTRLLGLLSGLINLNSSAMKIPLQQAAKLGRTGHAILVDAQGRVLASTFGLPFLSPGEHATFYRQAMSHGQPVVDTVPFEFDQPDEPYGHQHVMAFAPLQMAPWGVAVGGDVDETFAGVTRLRIGLALLGTLSLASIWTATMIGARRLVRPVQRLTQAAQRIANGDLHTPLHAAEGGEIGAMAAVLERMRTLLLANIEELAGWNEMLETRVAERTDELRQQQTLAQQLLRRVITAQEEERARLSRELHDEIGQTLTAVQLGLDRLSRTSPAVDSDAYEHVRRVRVLAEKALADLRHIITALRPGVLDQLGLLPALGWVADHTLRPLGLTVNIDADGLQERLPGEVETVLFRIAQEAMSNVGRHSRASQVNIHLQRNDCDVTLTVDDDGHGFDLTSVTDSLDYSRGLGLAGMRERASLAGGRVLVDSAPGKGTSVSVIVPIAGFTGHSTEDCEESGQSGGGS